MANNIISLTQSQDAAFKQLKSFCNDKDTRVFILAGYAGTGKTTLLKTLFNWLENDLGYTNPLNENRPPRFKGYYIPLASTGRAAKVIRDKTGQGASTVHHAIYNFAGFNKDIEQMAKTITKNKGLDTTGELFINFTFEPISTPHTPTIYVIDEASMLTDKETVNSTQAVFGTGRVLEDLVNYDPFGKYLFVGDSCQLPPINDNQSPALNPVYMRTHYHFKVDYASLTQIIRQANGNDIILSAARMRKLCENTPSLKWGQFPMRGYNHIHLLGSQMQLVSRYVQRIKEKGYNFTTMLTSSNRSCNMLSNAIRPMLGFNSHKLMVGELLLITQNNLLTGLMNGDLVKVINIGNKERRAGLTFASIQIQDMATEKTYSTLLIEELLFGTNTNLTQQEQKALYIDFYYREKDKDITQKSKRFKDDMFKDPYLNAMRAVYGYVLTCHKAQGGEWDEVYVNIPRNLSFNPKRRAYQWLYTAETRASRDLFIVDDFFIK